jgi:hypothetical protein
MVSPLEALGILLVVVVHTFLAAVSTRFFRLRMNTRWGRALYAGIFVPLLLVASTILLTGALGIGSDVGRTAAVMLVLVVPLILGYSIDLFWIPAPGEIDLPETAEGNEPDRP